MYIEFKIQLDTITLKKQRTSLNKSLSWWFSYLSPLSEHSRMETATIKVSLNGWYTEVKLQICATFSVVFSPSGHISLQESLLSCITLKKINLTFIIIWSLKIVGIDEYQKYCIRVIAMTTDYYKARKL